MSLPIVERLRETAHAISQYTPEDVETGKLTAEAADTIETLHCALQGLMKYHMGGEPRFKGQCCFETDAAIDALKLAEAAQ